MRRVLIIVSGGHRFRDSACETGPPWRFQPATVRIFAPGADLDGDGTADYEVLESERRVRMLLDLHFTFEIAEEKGLVRSGGATRVEPCRDHIEPHAGVRRGTRRTVELAASTPHARH